MFELDDARLAAREVEHANDRCIVAFGVYLQQIQRQQLRAFQQRHQRQAGNLLGGDIRRRDRVPGEMFEVERSDSRRPTWIARACRGVEAVQRQAGGMRVNRFVDGNDAGVVGIIQAQSLEHVRQRLDNDATTGMTSHKVEQAIEAHAVVRADLRECKRTLQLQELRDLPVKPGEALDPIAAAGQQAIEPFPHGALVAAKVKVNVKIGKRLILIGGMLCTLMHSTAWSRGVSPYLPLQLSPEIERQIERVLILADKPVMSRPITAATVLDALPKACERDAALCQRVRRYFERYMHKLDLTDAGADVAVTSGAATSQPSRHGLSSDDAWQAFARAYWQPADHLILSLGGVANDGDATPTGSLLSVGFEYAQLDVGYRDHWLSPFTSSAMAISTQAPTLPSITLSNYTPITRFGLTYEVFLAEMERSERIAFANGFTTGHPRLAGLHFAMEPAAGWSVSANRVLQFGGGARGGTGLRDFVNALIRTDHFDNRNPNLTQDQEFGNQVASLSSRFIFPGPVPFAAYLEYAGEDRSYDGNFRLGNSALSVGINFPQLWGRFDLTYEASEWQNGWYVNGLYGDGLTNDGHVLGHWGADWRVPGDAVGAQSHLLRIGWRPAFGGLLGMQARTLANESYGSFDYARGYEVAVSYSRAIRGFTTGAEVLAGRDVFGENFGRLAGFLRFGDEWAEGSDTGWSAAATRPRGADLFVDAGATANQVQIRLGDGSPVTRTSKQIAPHLAIGARRAVSERSDLGVRAEIDQIDGALLLAVRAIDYRYRFRNPLALTAFVGAARYDLATPAYGYYIGAGVQWRDLLPRFDINVDFRYGDKVARDKLLPEDPGTNPRPDSFYDISATTVSLSYRF